MTRIPMTGLTDREWDVYTGIRDRLTPQETADRMGVTVSYVTQLRARLRDFGVIRRASGVPAHGRYDEVYAWELVSDQPPPYKPAMPPAAKLRLTYPQDRVRDVTVPPVRQLLWPQPCPWWSFQGIPMPRPDGRRPLEAMPEHRVLVITDLTGMVWLEPRSFVARLNQDWLESQTSSVMGEAVTDDDSWTMTQLIAAAIGVDCVQDLTRER